MNTEMPSRSDGAAAWRWSTHPLLSSRRTLFLDAPLHALTMEETVSLARQAIDTRTPLHQTSLNVAKLVNMRSNGELAQDVAESDIINVDGAGIVWGARLLGIDVPERVAGVDLMEAMFRACAEHGYRPFLLGAEAHVLEAVRARLRVEFPTLEVAGVHDGYFPPERDAEIVADINRSGADCLFVAMPTPRKERFLHRFRSELRPSFIMGVGGSFDVYGGKVKRAPLWMQKAGLEWLFRILQEPRRMWRRYWVTNPAYLKLLWNGYRQGHARGLTGTR